MLCYFNMSSDWKDDEVKDNCSRMTFPAHWYHEAGEVVISDGDSGSSGQRSITAEKPELATPANQIQLSDCIALDELTAESSPFYPL